MSRSLADRLRTHEQQKARLVEQEARIKLAERKARTRRLVEAGALIEKAGLLDLDVNALYGALLGLRDEASEPKQVAQWATLGGRAFAREARARDEGKLPTLLVFPGQLGKEATIKLRRAGFRYSRVMQHWEGLARPDDAAALALAHGGSSKLVIGPAGQPIPDGERIAEAAE